MTTRGRMEKLSEEELREALKERRAGTLLDLRERELEPMDLSGWDLTGVDFTLSSFQDVVLSGSSVENALFDGCPMKGASFRNANLKTASFRYCDMRQCDIRGADLFGAVLEYAAAVGAAVRIRTLAVGDFFVPHGDHAHLLKDVGLDDESIAQAVRTTVREAGVCSGR